MMTSENEESWMLLVELALVTVSRECLKLGYTSKDKVTPSLAASRHLLSGAWPEAPFARVSGGCFLALAMGKSETTQVCTQQFVFWMY